MAGYYRVDFISPLCTGLKIAVPWEVIQKQESLPCPWAAKSVGWEGGWLGVEMASADFYPLPVKAWSHGCAFQLPLPSLAGPQCSWIFPGRGPLIRGGRFPKASKDLETHISMAAW